MFLPLQGYFQEFGDLFLGFQTHHHQSVRRNQN